MPIILMLDICHAMLPPRARAQRERRVSAATRSLPLRFIDAAIRLMHAYSAPPVEPPRVIDAYAEMLPRQRRCRSATPPALMLDAAPLMPCVATKDRRADIATRARSIFDYFRRCTPRRAVAMFRCCDTRASAMSVATRCHYFTLYASAKRCGAARAQRAPVR